jgi:D-sedoheptulose 7-phosphate isomerase
VLNALHAAQSLGLFSIGLTGRSGGKMSELVDICLRAPSDCTPRIQEVHLLMVHLLCGLVETTYSEAPSREFLETSNRDEVS